MSEEVAEVAVNVGKTEAVDVGLNIGLIIGGIFIFLMLILLIIALWKAFIEEDDDDDDAIPEDDGTKFKAFLSGTSASDAKFQGVSIKTTPIFTGSRCDELPTATYHYPQYKPDTGGVRCVNISDHSQFDCPGGFKKDNFSGYCVADTTTTTPIDCAITYGEWGECLNGTQLRPELSRTAALHGGKICGTPVLSQSCVADDPDDPEAGAAVDCAYGEWGACEADGKRRRTATTGGEQCDLLTEDCIFNDLIGDVVDCVISYSPWGACEADGKRRRTEISRITAENDGLACVLEGLIKPCGELDYSQIRVVTSWPNDQQYGTKAGTITQVNMWGSDNGLLQVDDEVILSISSGTVWTVISIAIDDNKLEPELLHLAGTGVSLAALGTSSLLTADYPDFSDDNLNLGEGGTWNFVDPNWYGGGAPNPEVISTMFTHARQRITNNGMITSLGMWGIGNDLLTVGDRIILNISPDTVWQVYYMPNKTYGLPSYIANNIAETGVILNAVDGPSYLSVVEYSNPDIGSGTWTFAPPTVYTAPVVDNDLNYPGVPPPPPPPPPPENFYGFF